RARSNCGVDLLFTGIGVTQRHVDTFRSQERDELARTRKFRRERDEFDAAASCVLQPGEIRGRRRPHRSRWMRAAKSNASTQPRALEVIAGDGAGNCRMGPAKFFKSRQPPAERVDAV